ncbi:hypothetical protein BGZ67_002865 [Mortierella alpina]|nr:hypothetical protein BGZ67_002865 [Mortierella alpina]
MPTNLAEPTCPPLDDQTMSEFSPSSSSLSPTTSSAPSEPSDKHVGESLAQLYEDRDPRPQQQPQNSYQTPRLQYRQQLAGSECSGRSMSPPASPYSYMSSSPAMKIEASRDMPYWSPSTPSLQIDHQWSNHSSPLLSQQQHPLPADQKHPSDSWGYPLFEQMSLPMSMPDLGNCVAPSACQHTATSPKSAQSFSSTTATSMGTVPLNARRAARTPPHRRTSSELSGLRAYESMAYRDYNPHRYYRNATSATSSSSSSSPTNNNNNYYSSSSSNTFHNSSSSNGSTSSSYTQSSAGNNNNSSTNNSNSNPARMNHLNTRGGVKSYPCPTCSKPFPTRTQLKSHMAIHTDNFPFPCLYAGCDLHFKRKHDLRRHVDAKHALVKKYLCSGGCGEGFGRRDQMVRHLRRGACGQGFQTE